MDWEWSLQAFIMHLRINSRIHVWSSKFLKNIYNKAYIIKAYIIKPKPPNIRKRTLVHIITNIWININCICWIFHIKFTPGSITYLIYLFFVFAVSWRAGKVLRSCKHAVVLCRWFFFFFCYRWCWSVIKYSL